MPLFQYKCAACQAHFEAFAKEGEQIKCIACGSTTVNKEIPSVNSTSKGCGGCQGCTGCH